MKLKELFSDAFPIIEKFAPTFASIIGGVPGIALSSAIPLLANAFNASSGDPKQLVSAILSTTDSAEKLQSLEKQHSEWLSDILSSARELKSAEVNIKLNWSSDPQSL